MTRHYTYDNLPNSENWNWWDNLRNFFWAVPEPVGDSRLPPLQRIQPQQIQIKHSQWGMCLQILPEPRRKHDRLHFLQRTYRTRVSRA